MDHGNAIRTGLCALALAGVPVANAAEVGLADFAGFMQRVTGNNAVTVGIGSGGTLVATKPSAALGGTSGWSVASNFGSGGTSGGAVVGMSGNASVAGHKVPVTVSTPITRAALGAGMGILWRNAARLAGPVGVVMMLADMAETLQHAQIRSNPNAANDPDNPFLLDLNSKQYTVTLPGAPWAVSKEALCSALVGLTLPSNGAKITKSELAYDQCSYKYINPTMGYEAGGAFVIMNRTVTSDVPASWDQVRPKYEAMNPLPSDVLQKQWEWAEKQKGKNGIEPWKVEVGPSTVTTPSPSLQPKTETKVTTRTLPDGRTEERIVTTTSETTVSTTGDQVKVVPTTTTTTTTKVINQDGSFEEHTETETETRTSNEDTAAKPEDQPGMCDLYPDILACAKPDLDTPEGEIPRGEKQITYSEENLFGEGSCPADVYASLATIGQTVKVWDWQAACQYAFPLRALVIALATLSAFVIVMPGETRL
ncbi:IgG-binding virulence factor TspB family protein [Pseudorhodoferax sp.]|uniref:IgG-binding virulence factor TspB family protein n=1 Tax=Pseudorhodoferax sp. TaxID=1993553 RepID=UPI0039E55BAD